MTKIEVLVEGYASTKNNIATSTTTLIIDNNIKYLVDPGMDREKLLLGLKENGLGPSNINYVIQSHGHIDTGLTGIFENSTVIDNEAFYTFDGGFKEHLGILPTPNVKLLNTPGHDPNHLSVIVNTENGVVVIAADVFWWYDEEKKDTNLDSLINRYDEWAKDHDELKKSRQNVLEIADYIIPGHGKMFKVEKINKYNIFKLSKDYYVYGSSIRKLTIQ